MDKALKEKWVEALRSGEYEQVRRALRTNEGMCCLGVLADVAKVGVWDETEPGEFTLRHKTELCSGALPLIFKDEIGLTDHEEEVLFTMNDEAGKSFAEIADFIEAKIPDGQP